MSNNTILSFAFYPFIVTLPETIVWEIRAHDGLEEVKAGYINLGEVLSIMKVMVSFTLGGTI